MVNAIGVGGMRMTLHKAIDIVKDETVQRFPVRVTISDYQDALKMVLDAAKRSAEENK